MLLKKQIALVTAKNYLSFSGFFYIFILFVGDYSSKCICFNYLIQGCAKHY